MYRFVILLTCLFIPCVASANHFIVENNKCNLYNLESEKHEKVGKIDLKKNNEKPYIFKRYMKVNEKEYAVLNDGENDYLVNKNCGYQKFDDKPKLEKLFSSDSEKTLEKISNFDKEILNLCGYFGSHPNKEGLRNILVDEKYKSDFEKIYNGLNKKIHVKTDDKNIFLSELLDVLFNTSGFSHTICGILKEKKMSGPHYYYRFLDLQRMGVVGKNNAKKCLNFKKSDSKFIENISVDFIDKNNEIATKCTNTFIKDMDAVKLITLSGLVGKIEQNLNEIKKIDTNIDTKNHEIPKASHNKSCIYKDASNNNILFKIVYNDGKKSLITLYPIMSDKCLEKNIGDESKCFCKFESDN